MKNDIVYKIPQIEIQKFFNLDNKEFQELKKQVGINTVEHLNQNNLSCMISFFRKVNNKDDLDIKNFNLKLFEVKEHEEVKLEEIKDIPEPKKIKIYKEKKTKFKKARPIEDVSSLTPTRKINKNRGVRKRIFTEQEDKKILEYYNSDYYKNPQNKSIKKPYTLKDLCRDLGASDRRMIANRASELGFTNFSLPLANRTFTDKELELLKTCLGKYQTSKIQKIFKEHGFTRSIVALNVQIQRLKLSTKLDGRGDLTLRLLSEAFGVDTHYFTDNEARMRALNPTKTNKELIFTRENIKKYVIENPYDINLGKVDNKFFIELLTGATNDNNNRL